MRIFYRKNVLCDISSVDDLEIFVKSKSFYKYFIQSYKGKLRNANFEEFSQK